MFMDNVGNARKDVRIIFVPLPFLSSFSKFVLQGQIIGIHVSLSSSNAFKLLMLKFWTTTMHIKIKQCHIC